MGDGVTSAESMYCVWWCTGEKTGFEEVCWILFDAEETDILWEVVSEEGESPLIDGFMLRVINVFVANLALAHT